MADETNRTVDFLNNITNNPDEVFKEESPTEEKVEEEEVEEKQERVSFAKDEKLQKFIEKQVEKRLAKMEKPTAEQQFRKEVDEINLPASFIKLVGNDTEEKKQVLKDLSSYFGTLKGEARKEFLEEMQEQQRQVVAQDEAALEELNAGFEAIEEEHGVDLTSDSKTRTAFVEYLRKVSHKNAEGEVDQFADIPSAWEAFQERVKPSASRAKELASRGMTRSTDTTNQSQGLKSGSRDPWQQVENHFAKLKSNN